MKNYEIPVELIQKYVERRWVDLKNCRDALATDDFLFLMKFAHQMKGNAGTYGFPELGVIAEKIEFFSKEKNKTELNILMDQFLKYLEHIKFD